MLTIEMDLQTSIHRIEYDHRIGPFRWGRRLGLPIVIPRYKSQYSETLEEWGADLSIESLKMYRQKLIVLVNRSDPSKMVVGATLSEFSYARIREVSGIDINTDPQLSRRYFFQE